MTVTGTRAPAGGPELEPPDLKPRDLEPRDLEHRPSYLDLLARPNWSNAVGQAWLLTFTDLIALMLAFFVLMFAMSQIEQRNWQGLVDALASDLNALRKVENVKPALDFQPEEEAVVPGSDLDYLTPIIREQFAAHPLLAQATIHRAAERLVISLPAGLLFGAGSAVPAPKAAVLGSALVSVLRNLHNAVEVEAHLERTGAARASYVDWELTLARATAFKGILLRAGYTGRIVARATGSNGPARVPNRGPASSQGARLDVVIHESAREPR